MSNRFFYSTLIPNINTGPVTLLKHLSEFYPTATLKFKIKLYEKVCTNFSNSK